MWVIWWYAYFSSCGLSCCAMGLQSPPMDEANICIYRLCPNRGYKTKEGDCVWGTNFGDMLLGWVYIEIGVYSDLQRWLCIFDSMLKVGLMLKMVEDLIGRWQDG